MAKKSVPITETELLFLYLIEVSILAGELYQGNVKRVRHWIFASNEVFSGDSPLDVILRGDGKSVIEFLEERLGRKPGSAF